MRQVNSGAPNGRRRRSTPETRALARENRAATTDPGVVMNAAGEFLAVRARSVDETRRRLIELGYPQALVDHVVDRLIEMRYLDDAEFAKAWVESRDRARPRGQVALRRELALKGVGRDVIEEVLVARAATHSGEADASAAAALLERRRSVLDRERDPRRRRQKAYSLLARNGFDPETCREVSAPFGGDSWQAHS